MRTSAQGLRWPFPAFSFTAGLSGLILFLYVWLRVEPVFGSYHSATPFFATRSFFRQCSAIPGGLVDYGAAFVGQMYQANWVAALILSALSGVMLVAAWWALREVSGVMPAFTAFGPPFILVLLTDRYEASSLALCLAWLLTMGAVIGCIRLLGRWPRLGVAADWLLAVLLFFVGGLWPSVVFAVSVVLCQMQRRRHWQSGLACLAPAVVLPICLCWFSDANLAKVLNPWGSGQRLGLAIVLYAFVPLVAAVLGWRAPEKGPPPVFSGGLSATPVDEMEGAGRVAPHDTCTGLEQRRAPKGVAASSGPVRSEPGAPRKASAASRAAGWWAGANGQAVIGVILILLGWVSIWFAFNGSRKAQAQIDYYANHRQWDKVVAVASQGQALEPASEIRLHWALYHTGRLAEDLFSFVNQRGWDLLPALGQGLDACRAQSETLFELGQVNVAERLAHEALEFEGDRPDTLWLLARINILKDRPKAARVFLGALSQAPFQGDRAEHSLRLLESDAQWREDTALVQVRSRMVSDDLPHNGMPTDGLLQQLLHSNPRNQMAFEYLMAYYLLNRQVDMIVDELSRLQTFSYPAIPRHYEEAILLYQQLKGGIQADLHGRQIRPETLRRFDQFRAAFDPRGTISPGARQALARDFGDTFWYYYFLQQNAAGTSPVRSSESS